MIVARELARSVGTAPACQAMALARASFYRRRHTIQPLEPRPRPSSPRALTEPERSRVLELLHGDRFVDKAPAEVHATLLDAGTYLCSVRTMYRLLGQAGEVRERRNQLRHPSYRKPELLATAPNQVWSWDITKLLGPTKWTYFYLYVLLDIFSRYVVGWMLATRESAALATRLIQDALHKQDADSHQLTIHSDRGPAMKSHSVGQLLASLGVTKSFSRPNQSNDNPFSESQFKTLKYRPDFPDRFGSPEDAHAFCRHFFHLPARTPQAGWYNHQHHHAGIGMLTPATVHYGAAPAVLALRQRVLEAAYAAHPERFVNGSPSPANLPHQVWINPPANQAGDPLCATPAQELLIETDRPCNACPTKTDRTSSRTTRADESGRLQTRPESQPSLNNQSPPAATGMRVEGGSGGEGTRLPPFTITPCGAAAPASSQLPPLTPPYSNFQRQLSQNH